MPEPPKDVGSYRPDIELGKGGMGVVWRAVHLLNGTQVALKLVSDASQPWLLDRVRRDTRALQQLHHPGIVRILDQGTSDDGIPWYASPLVNGSTLERLFNVVRYEHWWSAHHLVQAQQFNTVAD